MAAEGFRGHPSPIIKPDEIDTAEIEAKGHRPGDLHEDFHKHLEAPSDIEWRPPRVRRIQAHRQEPRDGQGHRRLSSMA